jgi:pyridoxal/pyridoxine/pyridoxamine kinase
MCKLTPDLIHAGYGLHGGNKMPVEHLISCIDGLENNGLLTYDALLTGKFSLATYFD